MSGLSCERSYHAKPKHFRQYLSIFARMPTLSNRIIGWLNIRSVTLYQPSNMPKCPDFTVVNVNMRQYYCSSIDMSDQLALHPPFRSMPLTQIDCLGSLITRRVSMES